jgi:microcin C transport system substrate-binding protein
MQRCLMQLVVVILMLQSSVAAFAAHGVSLDGKLKYPPDFTHFSYVSPEAPKGGKVILESLGSFDKMNPYTLKGIAPYGLEMLVFESLAVGSMDEPVSEYGLIAKSIDIAEDRKSVTFTLNPAARFSDGTSVTVEDIAFSLETVKGKDVHPMFPHYYKDIQGADIISPDKIRFNFTRPNRELHLIATQIPIFSKKHYLASGGMAGLEPPTGSGPYIVSKVEQGKFITYTRNPDYWAKDHPVRKGMFNFDTITVKYYKDQVVSLEAFKAGEFDFLPVNIAKQWARDMDGDHFTSGKLVKTTFPHQNNAGMQGFLMNTRKKIFADRRVRQAMGLALDFEWTNASLFYGQYTRMNSFFSNSYLAATGLPEGLELRYLNELKDRIPAEVFTSPLVAPKTEGQNGLRQNLRAAKKLLQAAGWEIKDGVLVNAAGEPMQFEITLVSAAFERVMAAYVGNLEKLGMKVKYRTIDPTLYTERLKTFDFDMIVEAYGQSLSPGNEQRNFWHSSAADQPGSENYAGVHDAAVDSLVDKIIYAENQQELTAACKAMDRVLWYGYYLVPNWYINGHRISYRNIFGQPETLPLYFSPSQLLMTWWIKTPGK